MMDFDGLLDEVLGEDANVAAPSGMEARVLARLSAAVKIPGGHGMWLGAAAAVLVAAGTAWSLLHMPDAAPASEMPLAALSGGAAMGSRTPRPIATVRQRKRSGVATGGHSRRLQREEAIQIAPIEIAPVAIEPVELASLTMGRAIRKGGLE